KGIGQVFTGHSLSYKPEILVQSQVQRKGAAHLIPGRQRSGKKLRIGLSAGFRQRLGSGRIGLRKRESPVVPVGSATIQGNELVHGIVEGFIGVKPNRRSVVQTPMGAQFQKNAWVDLVDGGGQMLAGGGRNTVAIIEPVKHMRPE